MKCNFKLTHFHLLSFSYYNKLLITVHILQIDPKTYAMNSAAIACKAFPGSHTGEAIAVKISEVNTSYGLDRNKIVATTTDNASNFGKCYRDFGVTHNDAISLSKYY